MVSDEAESEKISNFADKEDNLHQIPIIYDEDKTTYYNSGADDVGVGNGLGRRDA